MPTPHTKDHPPGGLIPLNLGSRTVEMLDALADFYDMRGNRSATMRLLIAKEYNAHMSFTPERVAHDALTCQ